jgi:hypothetical protein
MVALRKGRRIWTSVAVAFGLTELGLPVVIAQGEVMPAPQGAVATSSQGGTIMVPRDEVVYETVYDTQCVQVPTTQMQTQYKTQKRGAAACR